MSVNPAKTFGCKHTSTVPLWIHHYTYEGATHFARRSKELDV